jgi:hypothetical protein
MESKSSGEKASAEILRKIAILSAISKTRSATEIVQLQAVLFHRRNSFRGA